MLTPFTPRRIVPAAEGKPLQFRITSLLEAMGVVAIALACFTHRNPEILLVAALAALVWAGVRTARQRTLRSFLTATLLLLGFPSLIAAVASHRAMSPHTPPVCESNLTRISLALDSYEVIYGRFPPPYVADSQGRPLHSWRVLILPYLGHQALYNTYNFDEPWDGPNNRKLHSTIVDCFHCPDESPQVPATTTSYLAVVGPGSAWLCFRPTRLQHIGPSDPGFSLLVVESYASGVHWMEPRDLHARQAPAAVQSPRGQTITVGHNGWGHSVITMGTKGAVEPWMSDSVAAALADDPDGSTVWIPQLLWDDFARRPRGEIEQNLLSADAAKRIHEDAEIRQSDEFWRNQQAKNTGTHRLYYDTMQGKYWVRWVTHWERVENPAGTMAGPFDIPPLKPAVP
jgi:hypothetical protein